MPKKTDIMSYAAFKEIIDNMEHVEKLTPYGRRSIKHYVKLLQAKIDGIDKLTNNYLISEDYCGAEFKELPTYFDELGKLIRVDD